MLSDSDSDNEHMLLAYQLANFIFDMVRLAKFFFTGTVLDNVCVCQLVFVFG